MSTKIWWAYKFEGNTTELLEELRNFREKYNKKTHDMYKRIINELSKAMDHRKRFDVIMELDTRVSDEVRLDKNTAMNFSASAVVYPLDNDLYVQFFCTIPVTRFRLSKKFKDFHYQNSTDKPKSITNKEWEHRRKTWDRILDRDDIPSRAGFIYEIFDDWTVNSICMDIAMERRKKRVQSVGQKK